MTAALASGATYEALLPRRPEDATAFEALEAEAREIRESHAAAGGPIQPVLQIDDAERRELEEVNP